jgi:hypothetical protein
MIYTGYQVTREPYDAEYVTTSLLPVPFHMQNAVNVSA